jgi:hypothetical protein
MARQFTHPSGNGYTEEVGGTEFALTMVFGALHLFMKRAWGAGFLVAFINVIGVVAALLLSGGQPLVFIVLLLAINAGIAWAAQSALCQAYLKRGWHEAPHELSLAARREPATPISAAARRPFASGR